MPTEIEKLKMYVDHPNAEADPRYKEFELWYYPNSHAYKKNNERLLGVTGIKSIIASEGLAHYYKAEAIKYFVRKLVPMNDEVLVMPENIEAFKEMCKEASTAHNAKSQRGKDNGTLVHDWIEQWLNAHRDGTQPPEMLPKLEDPVEDADKYMADPWALETDKQNVVERNNLIDALEQFVEWWGEHTIEVVATERIIMSLKYEYAGRFDAILKIDGKTYMIDFKTSNPSWEYPSGVFPDFFCQLGGYDVAWSEEHHWDLFQKNESPFDGHAIFNLNKQTGKFYRVYSFDTKINRTWFVHTLGTKRGFQHHMRQLSLKYKENRPARKKPVKKAVK